MWLLFFVSGPGAWNPQGRQAGREDGSNMRGRKNELEPGSLRLKPRGRVRICVRLLAPPNLSFGWLGCPKGGASTCHQRLNMHFSQEVEKLKQVVWLGWPNVAQLLSQGSPGSWEISCRVHELRQTWCQNYFPTVKTIWLLLTFTYQISWKMLSM